jgi:O-succinylbenzoate synthase
VAAAAAAAGFGTLKVKVGQDNDDEARVSAVRAAVGPGVHLRLDANGAWGVEEAVERIGRLALLDLEFVEQPVRTLDELAELRRRVSVALAADESVRTVADARRLAAIGAADALVVKVQCLGGIAAAMALAEEAQVPVIVSSLYETSIGLAAGLAMAAAVSELPYACGLGAAELLAGDVVADPLVAVNGVLAVRRPDPDPALLARYADD